jgi:hypothetical protein
MIEPIYVRQAAESMSIPERRAWLTEAGKEAAAKGATFCRYSMHPDIPDLVMVEGWSASVSEVMAAGGQGEPRWALTTTH